MRGRASVQHQAGMETKQGSGLGRRPREGPGAAPLDPGGRGRAGNLQLRPNLCSLPLEGPDHPLGPAHGLASF